MHDRFAEQLSEISHREPAVRIVQINGPYEQRLATAIAAVDALLNERMGKRNAD
jgi:nicotinamide riboside kinase